jgi:hypothetical protein
VFRTAVDALAFVKYKLELPSLKSSVSLLDKLSSVAAIVKVFAASSYVRVMLAPAVNKAFTLSSTLSFV